MKQFCWHFSGVVLAMILALAPKTVSAGTDNWFASAYVGQYSNTALNEIIRFNTDVEDSYVTVLSVGKGLGTIWNDRIGMELEGQLGTHSGDQSHQEVNLSFTLRWLPFPWDQYLDTSFAFGNGLSYAMEEPELEIREADDNETTRLLYYILVETAFSLPDRPQWDLFIRIHHRSSVFGTFDNTFAASNFVGLGLRYHFWIVNLMWRRADCLIDDR